MTTDRARALASRLVEQMKQDGEITDPRIERAFLEIPRHVFLPEFSLDEAYANQAVPIKRDRTGRVVSSVSQPSMIALMLEQLQLEPGMNVLEIGTATGYNAALIQHIVGSSGRVTSVELDIDLIERAQKSLQRVQMNGDVTVVQGDGAAGYAPRAQYDRIIATAGIWDVPPAWERQLKSSGILVTPLWLEAVQVSAAFRPAKDGSLISVDNLPCWFVLMRGVDAGPGLSTRVGNTSLEVVSTEIRLIDGAALQSLMTDWAEVNHFDMPLDSNALRNGFLPYLTLNEPPESSIAYYVVGDEDTAPYGVKGSGFALVMQGSACFVPYGERGAARCFGAADAFIAVQDCLTNWRRDGEPGIERLNLRLSSPGVLPAQLPPGRTFTRRYHTLHAWYGEPAAND